MNEIKLGDVPQLVYVVIESSQIKKFNDIHLSIVGVYENKFHAQYECHKDPGRYIIATNFYKLSNTYGLTNNIFSFNLDNSDNFDKS